MSTTLRFKDHDEFHRAALHMAIAGCGAGLVAHVAGLVLSRIGPVYAPIPLALIAVATAYGAAMPEVRIRLKSLAGFFIAGLAGATSLYVFRAGEPSLGAGLFALIFGYLFSRSIGGKVLPGLIGGVGAFFLASFVLTSFATADSLRVMPSWLLAVISGASFAGVSVLGLLPRHLGIKEDRIEDAWKATKGTATGELKELLERAQAVWGKVDETLDADAEPRKAIEESVLRLFEAARQWPSSDTDGGIRSAESLAAELTKLDGKIAATSDSVAKSQYKKAREALAEQQRYLTEIETSRERVIARVHHYVAAMERLRFAVINNRSSDASRLSSEVQPMLDDLESLGKEMDITSQAMDEVETESASN